MRRAPTARSRAVRSALAEAAVPAETVEFCWRRMRPARPLAMLWNCEALLETYGGRGDGDPAVLGSVKSQIGHTKAAAGAASLIKAALALHQRVLPPTIGVSAPLPKLAGEDAPMVLLKAPLPWAATRRASAPRGRQRVRLWRRQLSYRARGGGRARRRSGAGHAVLPAGLGGRPGVPGGVLPRRCPRGGGGGGAGRSRAPGRPALRWWRGRKRIAGAAGGRRRKAPPGRMW
ncbi:MAG: hypothetical protein WDN49_18675 [Acetobacteraceae bacterium]